MQDGNNGELAYGGWGERGHMGTLYFLELCTIFLYTYNRFKKLKSVLKIVHLNRLCILKSSHLAPLYSFQDNLNHNTAPYDHLSRQVLFWALFIADLIQASRKPLEPFKGLVRGLKVKKWKRQDLK